MPESSLADILEGRKSAYQKKVADILGGVYKGTIAQIEHVERYIDSLAQSLEEGSLDTRLNALLANEDNLNSPAKKNYTILKLKNHWRQLEKPKSSPEGKQVLSFDKYSKLRDKGQSYKDIRAKYPGINYRTIVGFSMVYASKHKN